MSTEHISVAIRTAHTEVKHAAKALQHPGFDLREQATAANAKDAHAGQHAYPYYNLGNRIKRR